MDRAALERAALICIRAKRADPLFPHVRKSQDRFHFQATCSERPACRCPSHRSRPEAALAPSRTAHPPARTGLPPVVDRRGGDPEPARVVKISSTSQVGFEVAINNINKAGVHASRSLGKVRNAWFEEQIVNVENGQAASYRANRHANRPAPFGLED